MRNVITLVIVGILVWYGYTKYRQASHQAAASTPQPMAEHLPDSPAAAPATFKCDGRTYCSQMTSCEEATFFLRNCPNTKMDGNNDGVPCEKQWCRQ